MENIQTNDLNLSKGKENFALASFIIGCIGAVLMFVPIINLINILAQMIGIILGVFGRRSSKKKMALAGIILSSVSILLSIAITVWVFPKFVDVLESLKNVSAIQSEKALEMTGGLTATLKIVSSAGTKVTEKDVELARILLTSRLKLIEKQVSFKEDMKRGIIYINIAAKSKEEQGKLKDILIKAATLPKITFQEIDENSVSSNESPLPTGKIILNDRDIKDADSIADYPGGPCVTIQFSEKGKRKFSEATGRLIGKRIGIFLDDRCISAPTVLEQSTTESVVINGQKSMEEAEGLAKDIRAGLVPYNIIVDSIKIVERKN
ncbi:MAG: hypothetical protein N2645_04285 [Clostridia bacterium]|nr:hypothetical protein [Clostridia bacterium]